MRQTHCPAVSYFRSGSGKSKLPPIFLSQYSAKIAIGIHDRRLLFSRDKIVVQLCFILRVKKGTIGGKVTADRRSRRRHQYSIAPVRQHKGQLLYAISMGNIARRAAQPHAPLLPGSESRNIHSLFLPPTPFSIWRGSLSRSVKRSFLSLVR